MTFKDIDQIIEIRKKSCTIHQISIITGFCTSTISKVVKKAIDNGVEFPKIKKTNSKTRYELLGTRNQTLKKKKIVKLTHIMPDTNNFLERQNNLSCENYQTPKTTKHKNTKHGFIFHFTNNLNYIFK